MIFIKKIYIISILCLLYLIYGASEKKQIVIPEESIRFRIIANSNSREDQNIKMKVKDNIEKLLPNIIEETSNIVEAESNLKSNINLIKSTISQTLERENRLQQFDVSIGKNYFPEKDFYGIKYPSGEYESLVVTLGEGTGDNWWCVLFPPLCLIEAEETEEVEYKLYIQEILEKYM